MAITVRYEYATFQSVASDAEVLDKRAAKLISSKMTFVEDDVPLSFFELLTDFTVKVGAVAAPIILPASAVTPIRTRINIWIDFVDRELHLAKRPQLKTKKTLDISEDKQKIDFTYSVFTPGIKKLLDFTWEQATNNITFSTRSEVIIPWGDFIHWQLAVALAFEFVLANGTTGL